MNAAVQQPRLDLPKGAQPQRAPDSDKVAPTLIIGGSNAHRFATLAELAQDIRDRVGERRLDLTRVAFHHDAAQGFGVNVWAGPADGREWIGTAAGRGVAVGTLAELLAPHIARAA